MEIVHIILTSVGSIVALFLLTKLIGCRQMSQLSMFDYINGITIGSIAAEMATSLENDFLKPLTAMVVYALFTVLFSKISEKSILARHIIVGRSVLLYDKGTIYYKNMQRASLDINEFLSQCRIGGYFDLDELQSAVLEANGRISFLPKADKRPLNPSDIQLKPETDMLVANVIIDGHVMTKNLHRTGHDEQWLKNQISAHDVTDFKEVFLATCDIHNHVCVYKKTTDVPSGDVLN